MLHLHWRYVPGMLVIAATTFLAYGFAAIYQPRLVFDGLPRTPTPVASGRVRGGAIAPAVPTPAPPAAPSPVAGEGRPAAALVADAAAAPPAVTGSAETPAGSPGLARSDTLALQQVIPVTPGLNALAPPRLPPARVVIPSIGLDARVAEVGLTRDGRGSLIWQTAAFAVGHHMGTAYPGQAGNMVLSGHISSVNEGAVFKRLPEVKVGDGVVVGTADEQYLFRVMETKVVEPSEVSVLAPTPDQTVTLITCVPDGVFSHRLIVTAKAP